MSFYDKYVELCKLKGVTPSRAAVDIGLSKSAVTFWKADTQVMPNSQTLQRLAQYFDVDVNELLGIEKSALKSESGHKIIIDPTTEEIKAHLPSLTTEEKEALLRLVKVMKDNRKR